MDFFNNYQNQFNKVLEFLKSEFSGLRTGRANAALLENISVSAYGSKMPLKGLAGISIPDPKTIIVDPWDKSLTQEIETAIRNSGRNLNPVNEGNFLRVIIPPLTEESRRELVRVVGEKGEEARIRLRRLRDEIKNKILTAEENKEINEDERFKTQDQLDKKVSELNAKIREMAEEKEEEIMKI